MMRNRFARLSMAIGLLTVLVLLIAACAAAPTEAPAEEVAAAPTEAPAEEAAPTEAPEEEAAPTEAPEEEATAAPEEEATAAPEEEATAVPAEEDGDATAMTDEAAAGQYIALLTGGCGCHMNRDLGALAGGNSFAGGAVSAANITPDEATGIGSWSAEDIATTLRTGATPSGEQLHPAMPYMRFSALSTQEAMDIAAWLLSLDPVSNEVPERTLDEEPAPYTPAEAMAEAPTDPVSRGEQLVTLTACGGCHTPKNDDGSPIADMMLAGAQVQDEFAANITPDEETGIGSWSEEEIANFLRTGAYPDGSLVEGAMGQQITRRFSTLTEADAAAIAAYLKTIPAVENSAQ